MANTLSVRVERAGTAPEVHRFDRHVVQVGREPGCDLVLGDEGVAGRHLVLGASGGQVRAYDQGAGTTVNGRRVGTVTVGTGDVIGVGVVRLVVALGDDALPPIVVEAPRVRTLLEVLEEDHKAGRITDFEYQSRHKAMLRDGTGGQPAPVAAPVAPAAPKEAPAAPTGWGTEKRIAPNVWSAGGRTDDPSARVVHAPLASGIGDGKAFLFLFGFRRASETDQKMMAMELEHLPAHVEVLRRAGYTVVVDKEANRADFLAAVAGQGEGVAGLVPAGFYWSAHGEEDGALHCSDGDVVEPTMVDAAKVAPGLRLAVLAACYVGCRSRTWRKALGGGPLVVGWGRPVNMVRAVEFLQSNPDTNADLDDLIRRFLLAPGPIPPDHGDRFAATAEASARARLGDVPTRIATIADRLGARWRNEARWVLLEVPVDEGRRQIARVFIVDSAEPHSEGEPLLAVESEVGELSAVVDSSTLLAGLAPPSYARVALVKGETDMPRIVTQGFLPLHHARDQDLAALIYQVAAWGDVLERRIFGGDRR